jgi:hypothetical protein
MYGIKHNQTIVFASVARGGDTGELILTLLLCDFVLFLLCKMTARAELYGSHVETVIEDLSNTDIKIQYEIKALIKRL